MTNPFFQYWGKTAISDTGEATWHPLVYHCLDVAAVADRLLARHPRLHELLVRLGGLPEPDLSAWIRFFVAIHDLGKFSSAFQQLAPFAPPRARHYFYTVRHDTLAHIYWRKRLYDRVKHRLLGEWADGEGRNHAEDILDQWVMAVSGHHGQPPKTTADDTPALHFSPEDEQALNSYVDCVAALFLVQPPASFPPAKEFLRGAKLFSWWLAGLTVLADWLGSNRAFFGFCSEPMPFETYWRCIALPAADRALDNAGLLPNSPNCTQSITQLFNAITTPTPLQVACTQLPISQGPQLFLIEDLTGAGKTEAAFVLLNRLLAEGSADGAYLALPTMATANAMYRRTAEVYRRLFADGKYPTSLVLAHGSRHLDDGFSDSVLPRAEAQGEYAYGEPEAGAHCNAWLADGSKRALLAQMGVGTLDQALLAVLTSRHQSLRLLGLLDKVLLVDEVHASDAYMHRLLCELLTLHARAGGSTILLSATLPRNMRDDLVQAFCDGADRAVPRLDRDDYPLLTRLGVGDEAQVAVPTRACVARTLGFELIHDEATAEAWIATRAEAGACVAWVRNTVSDAMAAYERLSARLGHDRVTLFHARFAMGDRLRLEDEIVTAFGNSGGAQVRAGRVVIATQVIEQSLDLDFDEMVSDLAPVDLLLQRAGRLRRHTRDGKGDVIAGPDQRGPVVLRVLAPDPDAEVDSRWYIRLLPHAAPVYPDHGQLWATARLLKDRGRIAVPKELRLFIESVFGELAPSIPEPLLPRSNRAEGTRSADASQARFNAIKPGKGYRHEGADWWDESYTPTRLGDVTTTLRLARWDGLHLHPWSDDPRHPWPMSEVRARGKLNPVEVAPGPLADAIKAQLEAWGKGFNGVLLALTANEGHWTGAVTSSGDEGFFASYSDVAGLRLEKIAEVSKLKAKGEA